MSKIDIGYFQKADLIEELARKFYSMQGYEYTSEQSMSESPHPTEVLMYEMAYAAVEKVLSVCEESITDEDEEEYEDEEKSELEPF
jgi:hypothetical protein